MPAINRIRVNNVKYNFGTQEYDDFTMRLYGQNTLYDLANGGGKSVLMLLLMQCMIPNCTLDDKQPLEKLFRDNCGNGTIHSLIEWKLDKANVTDGFRFMTTGFCARKARDRGEEGEREVASVEYFNYCIFYQEYGKHDIVNLPLTDGENRMTYQALKNYLHDLSRKENRLKVFIFDRKGEYQRFISGYGIIESQWEIVRGINRTEGHVRTYFESNYRTTRKVVEDLLIEEIIEKAYRTKTEQEEQRDGSAASLLMSIRGQLRELAEKKRDISIFDHEAELLRLLRDRICSFGGIYDEKKEVLREIGGIYLTLDSKNAEREKELVRLQDNVERAEREADMSRAYLERLKTAGMKCEYEEKERALEVKQARLKRETELADTEERAICYRRAEMDYLLLREEEAKLESLLAEEREEAPEEIGPTLAGIRRYYQKEEERIGGQLEEGRNRLRALKAGDSEDRRLLTDARIELAVMDRDEAALAVERTGIREKREAFNAKLSEASLQPLELRSSECRKKCDITEREILRLQQEISFSEEDEPEKEKKYRTKAAALKEMEWKLARALEAKDSLVADEKRINEIIRIYHAETDEGPEAGSGRGTAADTSYRKERTGKAAEAVYKKLTADLTRLSELERTVHRLEKRRDEIREGRLLQISEGVDAVLRYISTRHGTSAMFGMDYLAQLPGEERERLLNLCPELPYGIVARGYETLREDEELLKMEAGGALVRIYDWDAMSEMHRYQPEHSFSVVRETEFFLSEDTEQLLLRSLTDRIANAGTELAYLGDAVKTEQEDLAFLLARRDAGAEVVTEAEVEPLRREVEELGASIEAGREERRKLLMQLDEKETLLARYRSDAEALAGLMALDRKESNILEQLSELKRTRSRLQQTLREKEGNTGVRGREAEELASSLAKLEEKLTVQRVTWQEQYAAYAVPGAGYAPAEGTLAELEARFRLWKQGREAAEEVLRQRSRLKESLEGGIRRLKQGIEDRSVELSDLSEAFAAGRLLPGSEEELREREEIYRRSRRKLEESREQLSREQAEIQRLEGSIEYALRNYREAFGEYEETTLDREALLHAIPEAEKNKKAAKERLEKAREEQKEFQKQSREWDGLYREAGRLVERNRIDLSISKEYGTDEDLQKAFEELLLRLDRNEKSLERANSQMLRTKGQVTQTLMEMGAGTLSISIRDDAELPKSSEEAEELAKRLTDMEELILMERARVEQGISDMERLKENFVEQCLERCLDVRTELEKLPRLSQIRMGDEMIQMVKLSIPYVKDEFLRQRMAEHIDRIVAEADSRKTEEEQHRFLSSELALKRLFGVIVTDMNRIRLQLYKRERVKEQSRYLRYEEAVGSTGQSQGIYIQFLISVINYIAGMYSAQDTEELTKTIFIDNPFGAAKDIYIWEPIFALLAANRVQLIVPSRGATPEITARFDVNYVLGQQMAEGKAITVVTRYSSRSDEEMTEYKELSYEQATFDFI